MTSKKNIVVNIFIILQLLGLSACSDDKAVIRVVGQLESDRIELTAEFAEPIVEWMVREGESVEKGQIILRQNDSRILTRMAEAEASLEQHRARLDELIRGPREEQIIAARSNVAGAIHDLEFREIEYERALKVHELKLASPKSLDSAKATVDSAKATLEFHEAQLKEMLTGTTIEELRQSESRVKQAEAILSSLNIDLDRHEIIAPVDGIVDVILFEVGERPNIGVPTVVMLAGTQPYVRAYIPETVRALLRTGDPATIYIDGIEEVFTGRIRWISTEAAFTPYFALTQKDRGRLTFFSKIDVLSEDKRLADGVPVEVEFKTDNHDL